MISFSSWFRYVAPGGRTGPADRPVRDDPQHYTSRTFETVCQQAVQTSAFPVSCSPASVAGGNGGEEIDVVGLNQMTDAMLLGECKWTSTRRAGVIRRSHRTRAICLFARTIGEGATLFSRPVCKKVQVVADERPDVYLYGARRARCPVRVKRRCRRRVLSLCQPNGGVCGECRIHSPSSERSTFWRTNETQASTP